MELSVTTQHIIIAIVALLLYAFAWRITRDLPSAAAALARLALALVLVVPAVLAIFFGAEVPKQVQAPRQSERTASAPPPATTTPPPARPAAPPVTTAPPPAAPDAVIRPPVASAPVTPPPPPTTTAPSPQITGGAPPVRSGEVAPSAPAPAAPPLPVPVPPPTGTRGALPPTATPLPEGVADIVPVFYGTDRGRDASRTDRLDYTSERGRRLELGRALVTVPKAHQVPQIERPWVYTIPFTSIVVWRESEDPTRHFTIREIRALEKDELLAFVRERLATSAKFKDHAVVFVHGFNTTFDFALYRMAQIAYDLQFDGASFVYSWPSRGRVGLVDYNYDRESTQQAEPHLKAFMEMVTRETGAKTITVIAHSMGNQALMPVLRLLKQSAPEGVAISQLIFAAPDVDRDNFEFLAREIAGVSRGSTLLAASNDRALDASMQLAGGPRAGDVPPSGPLVINGIDTIDVTAVNTSIFSLGHAGYAESKVLIDDLQRLILEARRLPDMRSPPLVRVETGNGPFWRYP